VTTSRLLWIPRTVNILLALSAVASAQFTPAPGSPFLVGLLPESVAVGDFNRDGKPDLAIANKSDFTVTVLLGNGTGGFTAALGSPFPVGAEPQSVAVGDFNGDGKPDLAIANSGANTVTVLLGNGAGGFTPAPDSPFPVGAVPVSVAVGDFNGDGKPDLAIANQSGNTVTVLLGNGTGGFTAASGSPFPVGTTPVSVAVGDFNGDGKPDLAIANVGSNNVTVLLGTGTGGFAADPGSPFAAGTNPQFVAVGDFNGDGKPDLAIANGGSNNVTVLLSIGISGFTPAPGSPFPVGTVPVSVAVGDFNGDGKLDLAIANAGSNNVTVLVGIGTGGFTAAPNNLFPVGAFPSSVAVGEFNGDGKPDLAIANALDNTLTVLLNNGGQIASPVPGNTLSGSLADFSWNPLSGATEYQLTVGTTPGAGNIFSGTTTATSQSVNFIPCTGATVYVQLSAEVNGSFQPATDYSYPCKSAMGDFNGSGFQDLVWQNSSTGQVNVNYLGGAGPQPQGSAILDNGATLAGWVLVGSADFDGNGVPDLIYQLTQTGQVNVNYYGGAGGTTMIGAAILRAGGAELAGWSVKAVADMNGDGVPDLIWQNSSSGQVNVNYYGGGGGASLIGDAMLRAGGSELAGWSVVGAGDFDGNGTPDLVWQNQGTGQVNVNYYGGSGGATLLGSAELNSGAGTAGWSVVGAADWNADGVPDLVWQNNSTLQVNVNYYGGSGGATLKGFNCLNCGSNFADWSVRAVAAVSSSGEPSLVWQSAGSSAVSIYYYGLGGSLFQSTNVLRAGGETAGWQVVAAADFDDNGVPDLIWQNSSTGQVNVNYYGGAGGATLLSSAVLNAGAQVAGWKVVAAVDMNGDGVPDLIWQNSSSGQVNVNYYGGAGGATLSGFAVLRMGGETAGWHVVGAGDFDGNGVPDLVWQNETTRQVNVNYYGGAGGASLIGSAVLNSGQTLAGWTVVGTSDFDGNGVPDLVLRNDTTGQVNVDYYGGSGGAVLKGSNTLGNFAGSSVIVPRSR